MKYFWERPGSCSATLRGIRRECRPLFLLCDASILSKFQRVSDKIFGLASVRDLGIGKLLGLEERDTL